MGVGSGLYMYDVVVKRSRSLSHLLMSSCTKRLRGLRNVAYERLNRYGLPTLELRRLQLDLVFCYNN